MRAREQTLRAESKGSKSHRERQERRGERSHRQRTRSRSRSRSSSSRSDSRSSESPDGHGRDNRRTKKRSRSTRSPSSSGSEAHFQKSSNPHRRRDSFDSDRVREAYFEARDAASRARDRPKKDTKFGRKQRSGRTPSSSQARSGVKPSTKKRVHSKETALKASFSLHTLERNQRGKLEKSGEKEGLLVEVREPSPASHLGPP